MSFLKRGSPRLPQKRKLQYPKNGIIFQSGIKGNCFAAASFMAGSSDEMVHKIRFFISIISKDLPQ